MWSTLRGRATSVSPYHLNNLTPSTLARHLSSSAALTAESINGNKELLSLSEVQKVLKDVGADDVQVIPASHRCEFTDYMVIATGRSPWHVRNISQALVYKVKQKQIGVKRKVLPTVVGQEGGKWIVIDSGTLIVHAVDEHARAYYNLEGLLTSSDTSNMEQTQDLEKVFVKLRRKNNSKKPSRAQA